MEVKVKDIIEDNSIWLPSKDYDVKKPKLSILMPTFGRGENGFFKRAVTSYINQTFKDTELIIVDDANTDGTSEQIDEFMKQDERISCIRHKRNMGLPSISSYEALKKARGEYIGFLFDDCVLYPSAYERSLKKMEDEGEKASYGRVFLHADIEDKSKGVMIYYKEEMLDNLEIRNYIGNITIIFKKEILEKVGYIDPHVVLSRVNDWDFITRIKRQFHLIETGVLFASEYGATQKNSLGNSYLMNILAIDEYLKTSNREEKLLNNYEEVDIFFEEENISYNLDFELKKSLYFFKNKYWISNQNKIEENKNFFDNEIIIEYNGMPTSSGTLIFNKNNSNKNQELFSCINLNKNIAKARAVILVREYNMDSFNIKKLRYAGIPIYLFWDDDFLLLSKEKKLGLDISESKLRKEAKKFQGLILTSSNFYENYKKKGYNEKNYLLNPIYLDKIEKNISKIENNTLNVAFTGGYWRIKEILYLMIEIFNNTTNFTNVTLYLPKIKELARFFTENKEKLNFKIEWYEFTFSYDQLINKLGDRNIHILIHPAPKHNNNENKTKNALITASLLGAALITTDEAPYNMKDSEYDTMSYLLVSNDEKNWTESIKKLLNDELRIKMIKEARSYCKKRYSASCLDEFIKDVLENTPKVDFGLYAERLEKLSYFNGKNEVGEIISRNIAGTGEDIVATKKINKTLKTFFISDKKAFSSIGVIFGTHSRVSYGNCEIKVFDEKNNQLYKETVLLEKIKDNELYNIHLDYLENVLNRKFYITFDFNYENSENQISLYERNYKYSSNKIIRNIIRPFRMSEIYVVLS